LPLQYSAWSAELKYVQDLLGDVHDLDVLGGLVEQASIFPDTGARARWQQRIHEERAARIEAYEKKTTGGDSLWQLWREGLPSREEVVAGAWLRLKLWASLLDPDFKHSIHVSQLALQIYDGLVALEQTKERRQPRDRRILEIAALLHDVGRSKDGKGHHKKSFRMIQQMAPPLGCRKQDLSTAAIVARYHRGALPAARQKTLTGLSATERKDISRLAAILRLATAFDASHDGRIQRVQIKDQGDILLIVAQGYSSRDRTAEAIAAARHLLEVVYRRPVMIKTMRVARARRASLSRPKEWKQRTLKTEGGIHKLAAAS
jgi:HD superfamily phosphodiesterase